MTIHIHDIRRSASRRISSGRKFRSNASSGARFHRLNEGIEHQSESVRPTEESKNGWN